MGLICLLIIIVAMISSVWPAEEERFIELGLLGKNKTADAYFTSENALINVGELNNWFIYVHNHIGTAQNVSVSARLLNSSMELPNDREHQPSNATSFVTFPFSLSLNQSMLIPFSWSIMDGKNQNDSVVITQLLVNNQTINIDALSSTNHSFIIVFELWIQNRISGEYAFSWESGEGLSSASVNMSFNVNLP